MMRYLIVLILFGLFSVVPALAGVEGDPFAGGGDFVLMPEEAETEESFHVGGYIESRNQLAVRDFSMPISVLQRARLQAAVAKDDVSFFASVYLEQELAALTWKGSDHRVWDVRPREIYAEYDSSGLSCFAGWRFLRWGTADGVNPLDVINPVDVVDPISTGRSYTRIPVLMSGCEVVRGNWSVEAVFLPIAAVQGTTDYGNPWEPRHIRMLREQEQHSHVDVKSGNEPDRWLQQVEYGVHVSTVVSGYDIEGIFFHGYENMPIWKTAYVSDTLAVSPEYKEFTAYGLIFAKGFEKNTIRGEFAYKPRFPCIVNEGGTAERLDLVQAVFGWDYDIDGKYYINIQVFGDAYGIGTDSEKIYHGLTYALSSNWFTDSLTLGLRGQVYTDGEGAQTEFFTEYIITDDWKLYTGVMLWTGKSDSYLGQYNDNDFVYLTLRYSF